MTTSTLAVGNYNGHFSTIVCHFKDYVMNQFGKFGHNNEKNSWLQPCLHLVFVYNTTLTRTFPQTGVTTLSAARVALSSVENHN